MKSIRKALIDASVLIDSLKLRRTQITAVTVYSWGDVHVLLDSEAFSRVVTMFGVPRSKVKFDVKDGYVHASCKVRGAEWSSCQKLTAEQWDELLSHNQPALPPANGQRISHKQPRLEFAK